MASVSLILTCQKSLTVTRDNPAEGGERQSCHVTARGGFSAPSVDEGAKKKKHPHKITYHYYSDDIVGDVWPLLSGIVGEPFTGRRCHVAVQGSVKARKDGRMEGGLTNKTQHQTGWSAAPPEGVRGWGGQPVAVASDLQLNRSVVSAQAGMDPLQPNWARTRSSHLFFLFYFETLMNDSNNNKTISYSFMS